MDDGQDDGNYSVGYRRPPVHTRWRAGQSGNPNGRPKVESIPLLQAVNQALRQKVTIPINGKLKKMSLAEAMAQKLVVDSAMGIASARRELFKLIPFADLTESLGTWTVINARPVFDEEERRLDSLKEENQQLRSRIEQLESKKE